VTVLRHGDFQEPLLGVYDRKTVSAAYDLLAAGNAPMRALESRVNWATFDYAGPEEFLMNCNTPQDFDQAHTVLASYQAKGIEVL